MSGFPTETDPLNGQTNVLDTQYVSRGQGCTAQNMNGVYLANNSASVGNSSAVVAAGTANPQDTSGRPGYLAVGEPGGNPSDVLVPGGLYSSTNNILDVSAPAGTAGGGGIYPQASGAGITAVPNPFISKGWTVQAKANEDAPAVSVVILPEYTFVHTVGGTITPTISGGTGPYSVTTVEVDGASSSTLPTGITLTAATGVLTISSSTSVAGTYTLAFRVTDSSSPAQWDEYEVTVIVT
jgi:hypothetical protein